jgi:chemotaxis protein CheZ
LSTTPEKELHDALNNAMALMQRLASTPDQRKIVAQVMASLKNAQDTNRKVFDELSSLSKYIADARTEISTIRPDAISGQHIPSATDELDAVVLATEEATQKIMDRCDAISAIAGILPPEPQGKITAEVTSIFEACNFQDITGQRITKVVRTLKHIETQVASLLTALEAAGLHPTEQRAAYEELNVSKATDTEKHLLNGPQLGDAAIKQDDIDKLFG